MALGGRQVSSSLPWGALGSPMAKGHRWNKPPMRGGSTPQVLAGFGNSGQLNMSRRISRTRESLKDALIRLDSWAENAHPSVHRIQAHSLVRVRAPNASGTLSTNGTFSSRVAWGCILRGESHADTGSAR